MAGGKTRVPCRPDTCALLCTAIRQYAEAAFPLGGSECAQASRDELNRLAERLARQQADSGTIELAGRQRGMLRGVVKSYFAQLSDDPADLTQTQKKTLLALLQNRRAESPG